MAHSKPVVLPAMHIETEIQCRVCMEQKRLQILGCGHKFCQACISQLAGELGTFPCPVCRRILVVPGEGFPTCFITEYLREQLHSAQGTSDPYVNMMSNNIPALPADAMEMLSMHRDLRPSRKMYTHPDGNVQELYSLDGTIQGNFRGKNYNFPLRVWLHADHPRQAPTVYVVPTSDMNIKTGPNINSEGKVQVLYLSEWEESTSNLTDLVSTLCFLFGKSPPLFNKPLANIGGAHHSQATPSVSKTWKDWGTAEIGIWLEELELGEYKSSFAVNCITGSVIGQLTKDDMKELGITKVGHRLKLEQAIIEKITENN